MSKEGDEMRIAGIIAAGVALVLLAVLAFACDETPDYYPEPRPAAVTSEGCALPDAGAPDALDCTCPDKAGNCAIPACGVFCCL
jgi:hypothetical protein